MRARSLLLLLVAAASTPLAAQDAPAARVGRLDTLVAATEDTSQRFAVYVPSTYDPARRWPVLFVLDPRGRARQALELFRPGAERVGMIVMSSYDSRSDVTGPDPNVRAINALLGSAQDRYTVDLRRLYFAGLSGTARSVIAFALELRGQVAGVIGVGAGAGTAFERAVAGDSAFAYFAAAGTEDFNHDEVRALASRLVSARVPTRLAVFDGPHEWPPASVCADAVEWLTLRAMRSGRAVRDSAWIAARLDAELATAGTLEASGRWEAASRLYASIARDHAPSSRAEEAARRAAAIEAREPMRRLRATMRELAEREMQRAVDVQGALVWYRALREAPTAPALAERLEVSALLREAGANDSLAAPSARRQMARIGAFVTFYEPRELIARGSYAKAARMLEVGASLGPLGGDACRLVGELRRRAPALVSPALDAQCIRSN